MTLSPKAVLFLGAVSLGAVTAAIRPEDITNEFLEMAMNLTRADSTDDDDVVFDGRRLAATPAEAATPAFQDEGRRLIDPNDDPLVCPDNVTGISDCTGSRIRSALRNSNYRDCSDLFTDAYLDDLCDMAKIATDLVEYRSLEQLIGEDSQFVEQFMDGATDWNMQTQQNNGKHNMSIDAIAVKQSYESYVKYGGTVLWPWQYHFHQNKPTITHSMADTQTFMTPPTCEMSAVMCCYVRDRQDDADGLCRQPYDTSCRNKNPDDNTDICGTGIGRSPLATHVNGGYANYPGNVEGSTHCHGMAWNPNDAASDSYRWAGNVLFYMTFYDHFYERGYVQNVPGAPMCACLEDMPDVSRADCVEADPDETWEITFRADAVHRLRREALDFRYRSCRGVNGTNNDLRARYLQPFINGNTHVNNRLKQTCP